MPSSSDPRRAETRSITIDAPPDTVLDIITDPTTLPGRAPEFARGGVSADGGVWIVDTIAGQARFRLRISREAGTVDLLAEKQPEVGERGTFSRVIPNGSGSEYLLTLLFGPAMSEEAIERQMGHIEKELARVKEMAEAAG
jgi:hypothetical protein